MLKAMPWLEASVMPFFKAMPLLETSPLLNASTMPLLEAATFVGGDAVIGSNAKLGCDAIVRGCVLTKGASFTNT